MRVKITDYRDFEILFDTDSSEFYTVSNSYDVEKNRKTFDSVKKWIDDFLKDNFEFIPFNVERLSSMFDRPEVIRIIGIRKDGLFVYEGTDGSKYNMSKYNEDDYFLIDPKNDSVKANLVELENKEKELNEAIKLEKSKLIKVSLKEIKNKYKI